MPREQITYPSVGQLIGPDGQPAGLVDSDDPIVHVRWEPGRGGVGHVQIAIEAGAGFIRKLAAESTSATTTLHSAVMNRDDINRMIRHLRRARDVAYGRDE